MKKLYIFIALAIFTAQAIQAQTVNVTFRVTLKGTGKKLHGGGLRVTGGLGSTDQPDWNPASAKTMLLASATADSVYAVTLKVPKPAATDSVLFKFINGDNWGDGANGATEDERGLGAPCAQASGDKNRIFKFKVGVTDTVLPIYVFNTCNTVTVAAVNTVDVTFKVTLKGTGKKLHAGGLRVTGALAAVEQPDWNPGSALKMAIGTPTADSVYSVTLKVKRPTNDTIVYKFVNGDNWGDGANGATEDERALGAPCANSDKNRIFKLPVGVTQLTLPTYIFNTCNVVGAAPPPVNVTFRVTLKGTGKKLHAGGLRVTGALGSPDQPDWNPASALKMALAGTAPVGDSIYTVTLKVPRPANDTIVFKFVNGDNWGDGVNGATEDERALAAPCANADKNRIFRLAAGATDVTLPIYRFNTCTTVEPSVVNITFRVTLKGTGKKLHAGGLRVTGALGSPDQADWNPGVAKQMTIGTPVADSVYSVTVKVTRPANDTIQYKFINGDNWGDGANGATEDERALAAPCANADKNRIFRIPATGTDFVIPIYRFNTCTTITSTRDLTTATKVQLAPNPATDYAILSFDNPTNAVHSVTIFNLVGQAVQSLPANNGEMFTIEKGNLVHGIYLVRLQNKEGQSLTQKLVIE